MYKVPCGPTAYFDCDDTLVDWNLPDDMMLNDKRLVTVSCREYSDRLLPNKYNIKLLIKMARRGHSIIVWSGGGADWAEAVVKALSLEQYVEVVTGKPTYYIDDIANPKLWMGKHGFVNQDGKSYGDQMVTEKKA